MLSDPRIVACIRFWPSVNSVYIEQREPARTTDLSHELKLHSRQKSAALIAVALVAVVIDDTLKRDKSAATRTPPFYGSSRFRRTPPFYGTPSRFRIYIAVAHDDE